MLLPDNMHPEFSIYYNGALVLKSLQQKRSQNLLEIYQDVKETYGMSFPILVLSLDWLYLLANVNNEFPNACSLLFGSTKCSCGLACDPKTIKDILG